MEEEEIRNELRLRQTEHTRCQWKHRYCVAINKAMMTTFNTLEVVTLALPMGTIGSIV